MFYNMSQYAYRLGMRCSMQKSENENTVISHVIFPI